MKKTLLLGTALVVGVAGFAQSTAKKAINPKYFEKTSVILKNKVLVEPQPTKNSISLNAKKSHTSTLATCNNQMPFTTSWNCFGTGGGSTTDEQNCLSYNPDLKTLTWTQRGSKDWSLAATSGFIQSTIIDASTGMVKDSIIIYRDTSTHHARFPSGVLLNPTGNTDYHKAIAVGMGQVTDGTNWTGAAYTPKPLWSQSAVSHTNPKFGDSLYAPAVGAGNIFGRCAASNLTGAPATDLQYLFDGKTVVSVGMLDDASFAATDNNAARAIIFVKGTLNGAGNAVNWTVDTIVPPVHKGKLGYGLGSARMAFGPDGMHGYIVAMGLLNTVYNNYCDSSFTPILYTTTDGGTTWTQKLAGYDWMCKHPEVEKNVGELIPDKRFYTFDVGMHGADLTVDEHNVLHFVTCVSQATFKYGPPATAGGPLTAHNVDSVGIYAPTYQYDYIHYHPIIWDFMTDGTDWKTMMVDSILSADCGSATTDTTAPHSAMGAGSQALGVSSHISVSRSVDGTKVFYGWADSDPSATGIVYNTSPDILMKGYDVVSGNASATKNVTGGAGTTFFPYLADMSYFDASQSAYVVPAVYTVGHRAAAFTPQTTYDPSLQADYIFTNCGTFTPAEFSSYAAVFVAPTGTVCSTQSIGINKTMRLNLQLATILIHLTTTLQLL
ncbi:MAG TPA: hypothetical protein VK835_06165 [Bacteroidia bacterium]|nr:hypothetical protein [Bacteroidia bacterium]